MRTSKLPLISATLLSIALLAAAKPTSPSWQLGPFTRPTNAPVITPNKTSLFTDPIAKAPIHWESLHTFNPAAIVRDNKIYVLYRAEDDTGKMQIGEHTSRLGLATSTDGITFTRLPEPVFYPAPDAQQSREWPGGVEDPRIVESDSRGRQPRQQSRPALHPHLHPMEPHHLLHRHRHLPRPPALDQARPCLPRSLQRQVRHPQIQIRRNSHAVPVFLKPAQPPHRRPHQR
jgi:beta-1,4-mannooligosaccharide phosphorylase